MSFLEKRLLIVEDDLDALQALQAWARQLGCDVQIARSGHEALELARSFKPKILIADYLLGDDLTGIDVIVEVRRYALGTACVLVTGVLQEALREALQRIDGVLILAKPLNLDRLRQIVVSA